MATKKASTKQRAPSSRKPRTPRKSAVMSAPAAEAAVATAAAEMPEADVGATSREPSNSLKRGDFLKRIAARSAMQKSDLRAAMELILDEMGQALDEGHDLALAPLGRLKQVKRKTNNGAEVVTLRLRRKTGAPKTGEG